MLNSHERLGQECLHQDTTEMCIAQTTNWLPAVLHELKIGAMYNRRCESLSFLR